MSIATQIQPLVDIASSPQVLCYNKGCGKMFDLNKNPSDACQFHPGVPVFHDALKGWSCCNKKSTDFTQFLSIPGCTVASHTNEKPVEPEKPVKEEPVKKDEVLVYETAKMPEPTARPTNNEPLAEMKRTVAPNLFVILEKLTASLTTVALDDGAEKSVTVGEPCKNATCQARYENEASNNQKCVFHAGVAIFHEGMKYWSCCQRKTSDFNTFLAQTGCTEGKHLWFKVETKEEKVDCRYDHHQTGGFVILTMYAKNPVPDKTSIKANQVKLDINISFEGGAKSFVKELELYGVVKLEESVVNFFPSKVEVKLKKADPITWPRLNHTN